MAKFLGIASKIIGEMEKEGNMKTLTFQQSASIDNELANCLKKVKNDFEVKEKNSRAFVSKIEMSSLIY